MIRNQECYPEILEKQKISIRVSVYIQCIIVYRKV